MLSLSSGLAIPGRGTWLVLPARDGVAPAGLLLEATPSLHPDIMSGTLLIPSMLLHGSLPVGILAVWFGDGVGVGVSLSAYESSPSFSCFNEDDLIKEFGEDISIVGEEGRKLSYEVKVGGELLYSKLEKGGFPDNDQIADAIQATMDGGKVRAIEAAPSMFWPATIIVGVLSVLLYAVFKLVKVTF